MVGLIVIAPPTALVAMSRSNVNWTVVARGPSLPVGVIAVTRGGPVDERRVVEEDPKDQERNERQADPEGAPAHRLARLSGGHGPRTIAQGADPSRPAPDHLARWPCRSAPILPTL